MPKIDHKNSTRIRAVEDLGAMVRTARQEMGLTQEAGALLAGVGPRFLSELERGKSTVQLAKALQVARAFGIRLSGARAR